jgi:uncharacterized protein YndB with AHSA1/START domain
MNTASTDRIEKSIVLRAPRSRVWRALADAREFSAWFGGKFAGRFVPGERVAWQVQYQGRAFNGEFVIDKVEPERLLSYRWHPFAVDPDVDYSTEPMTLVTFELSDVTDGTLLKVTESGFDGIPIARRAQAHKMNSNGWSTQVENVRKYVDAAL